MFLHTEMQNLTYDFLPAYCSKLFKSYEIYSNSLFKAPISIPDQYDYILQSYILVHAIHTNFYIEKWHPSYNH